MSERIHIGTTLFACVCFAFLVSACAGKDDVAPVDVEKQAFEDLREQIRDTIENPAREAEAIKLVTALESDLEALRESVAERKSRARKLNANYDTPREDFEAFFEKQTEEIKANRERVSRTRQALLATVTSEEYDAIEKARTNAMSAAIASIQSI